ncbi:MAG: small multi-drug export protein [Actinomycetota bacterium]|nr:small multi-drug export protein [Actinomycetota bacterium]
MVRWLASLRWRATAFIAISSWYAGIPVWVRTAAIAMVPVFELRGAIPIAYLTWKMNIWHTYLWAVVGNMIPVPFILLLLGPVSNWLRRHSGLMDRFFTWLFARTRRKHGKSFERWRDVALSLFVAIPLPGTGAWTGALAAFVFDVPFWPALAAILAGVLIAGVVVSVVVYVFSAIPLWLTLVSAGAMLALLAGIWAYGRRDKS